MPSSPQVPSHDRLRWLDGLRGAAALFVVLHHMWLLAWPGFPDNDAPWMLGWLFYGHIAVAVFIAVSGYSLAIRPKRDGFVLTSGIREFLKRRARRILPPFWAALVLSMAVFLWLKSPDPSVAAKSFFVHAVMGQTLIANEPPNGTFWSIAVEWQIYFLFPALLLLWRWAGRWSAVVIVVLVAAIIWTLGESSPVFDKIRSLHIQFVVLFALGMLAASVGTASSRGRRRLLAVLVAATAGGLLAATSLLGGATLARNWFWVDLAVGPGIAALLVLLGDRSGPARMSVFGSRPAVALGVFSYSLYLMHEPVLQILNRKILAPLEAPPAVDFALLAAGGLPIILAACWLFFWVFERPFLNARPTPGGAPGSAPVVDDRPGVLVGRPSAQGADSESSLADRATAHLAAGRAIHL